MRFDHCIDVKEHYVSKQKTETMRVILHNIIASCVCVNGHGSWKDLKYLLNCLRETHGEVTASQKPIFKYIVALACDQLKQDTERIRSPRGPAPTLAGKWVPREKSKKFGWQAKYLALYCRPKWCGQTLNPRHVSPPALKKCLTHYRKTIAFINRSLHTPRSISVRKTGRPSTLRQMSVEQRWSVKSCLSSMSQFTGRCARTMKATTMKATTMIVCGAAKTTFHSRETICKKKEE